MKTDTDKHLSLQVYDAAMQNLPPALARDLVAHRSDPQGIKKGNTAIMRLRVLPKTKAPIRFWSSAWCFYEIGVGVYSPRAAEGLNVGGIQFFQNPNMTACGNGAYRGQVIDILRALDQVRPGFVGDWDANGKIHFGRHYLIKDYAEFPVAVAANDLAWLIQATLPRFQAIKVDGQYPPVTV